MEDFEQRFELEEVYDCQETIKGTVSCNSRGLAIELDGYHDCNGGNETILIEFAEGVPRVVIWGDKTIEDPTHIISLDGAKVGVCKKCGSNLLDNYLCSDVTCPYSDRKQESSYIDG